MFSFSNCAVFLIFRERDGRFDKIFLLREVSIRRTAFHVNERLAAQSAALYALANMGRETSHIYKKADGYIDDKRYGLYTDYAGLGTLEPENSLLIL
jgi:hypothetical protein